MKKSRLSMLCGIVSFLAGAIIVHPAIAAPGDLDTSFAQNGFSLIAIPDQAAGRKVAIGSNGQIVVAGTAFQFSGTAKFVVVFPPNNVVVQTSFDAYSEVTGMAIQGDGKIVVAGLTAASNSASATRSMALARYNTDGSLDATFGTGGKVTTPIGVGGSVGGVAIQADGRIVVAGTVQHTGTGKDFLLTRFGSSGALDTTFGQSGLLPNLTGSVRTDFGGQEQAFGIALQSDDKIIAVGCFQVTTSDPSLFALARYNSNGSLDTSFNGGRVTTDFVANDHGCSLGNEGDVARDVAVQADGKIVVVGRTENPVNLHTTPALARYNSDGSLDTTFGNNGKVTTAFGDTAWGVVIQPDGKIVVAAGSAAVTNQLRFAMVRYTTNGALDTTFGNGGTVANDFRGQTAFDVSIQQTSVNGVFQGLLLLTGESDGTPCIDCVATARYFAYPIILTRPGTFALAPAESIQSVHAPFLYSFTWTVPEPENWHDLKTLKLRISDGDNPIITVLFDVASQTFSLINKATGRPGPSATAGDNRVLESPDVVLYMHDTAIVAAGPTSPTVTLNLSLGLKPQTAGHAFVVDVAATDDQGNDTGFIDAGTLTVKAR